MSDKTLSLREIDSLMSILQYVLLLRPGLRGVCITIWPIGEEQLLFYVTFGGVKQSIVTNSRLVFANPAEIELLQTSRHKVKRHPSIGGILGLCGAGNPDRSRSRSSFSDAGRRSFLNPIFDYRFVTFPHLAMIDWLA